MQKAEERRRLVKYLIECRKDRCEAVSLATHESALGVKQISQTEQKRGRADEIKGPARVASKPMRPAGPAQRGPRTFVGSSGRSNGILRCRTGLERQFTVIGIQDLSVSEAGYYLEIFVTNSKGSPV